MQNSNSFPFLRNLAMLQSWDDEVMLDFALKFIQAEGRGDAFQAHLVKIAEANNARDRGETDPRLEAHAARMRFEHPSATVTVEDGGVYVELPGGRKIREM